MDDFDRTMRLDHESATCDRPPAGTGKGTFFAALDAMTMTERAARWGGARLSRRLSRSLPWVGGLIAVATVASTMRRKGVISGVLDTGLNAVPVLGAAKNVLEVA